MSGFKLKEGQYNNRPLSDDEMWSAFSFVFSSNSKNSTSYKFGFLKSILDNLYNVDSGLRLTFDQLFTKFAEVYWNLILKYNLRQSPKTSDNKMTYIERILYSVASEYKIANGVPFEKLPNNLIIKIAHNVKMKCKINVVGALYVDTKRLFYSFSRKEEWIKINPLMYEFVCKHKVVLEKLNYYEWAKFLEKVNDDSVIVHLLDKLDESGKRHNLSIYRQILYDEFESNSCFYCGKAITEKRVEVDHFIPWSFVKDDNIWNLVLACSNCNRSKSDKLSDEYYLNKLVKRNDIVLLESNYNDIKNYKNDTLHRIYSYAILNGYDKTWKPKKVV